MSDETVEYLQENSGFVTKYARMIKRQASVRSDLARSYGLFPINKTLLK